MKLKYNLTVILKTDHCRPLDIGTTRKMYLLCKI